LGIPWVYLESKSLCVTMYQGTMYHLMKRYISTARVFSNIPNTSHWSVAVGGASHHVWLLLPTFGNTMGIPRVNVTFCYHGPRYVPGTS
jgi:hypothetical protein